MCLNSGQTLFKSAEFFFLLATLHSQKIVKEIAYILTSYQALLKAQFFSVFFLSSTKDNKQRDNSVLKPFIFINYLLLN